MIYIENKQDLNHNHNNDANRSLEPRGQSVGHWGNDDTAQGDLLTPQWQRTHLALPTHLALSVLFQVALG